MASQNSFQRLDDDVPAPDSSDAGAAEVHAAVDPTGNGDEPPAQATPRTAQPTTAAKRPRAAGLSDGEDEAARRQEARRADPANPFRLGDTDNPAVSKYREMCEERHRKQVEADGNLAKAAQAAFDGGLHPDRVPFEAQPDDEDDDMEDIIELDANGDPLSPSAARAARRQRRLTRAPSEGRGSAPPAQQAAHVDLLAEAGGGVAEGAEVDAAARLPPPLGRSRAQLKGAPAAAATSLTDEQIRTAAAVHSVFAKTEIPLAVAPADLDIDGRSPNWLLANVAKRQAADWGLFDGPHFVFLVPGAPMSDEARATTAAQLQSFVERSTRGKEPGTKPQVAAAYAEDTEKPLLNVFFVHNISTDTRDGYRAALAYRLGFENKIVFTFDLSNRPSPFMYTSYGLSLDDVEKDATKVAALLRGTLKAAPTVRNLIVKAKPSLAPELSKKTDDELVDFILDSARASGMRMMSPTQRGVEITQWNMFLDRAHHMADHHRELRATVAAIPIVTSFHGTGRLIKKHWYCITCMSISHPSGLCPFSALPGWSPEAEKAGAVPDDIDDRIGEAAGGSTRVQSAPRSGWTQRGGGGFGGRGGWSGRGPRGGRGRGAF